MYSSAISKWISSVANYKTWRIIEVSSSVPTTEFIDPKYREEAMRLSGVDLVASSKPLRGRSVHLCLMRFCTLTQSRGRWVRAVEYKTNRKGEGSAWFRTHRPTLQDGWFWLGQSLNGRWALLVREQGDDGDALAPVSNVDCFHTNPESKAIGRPLVVHYST